MYYLEWGYNLVCSTLPSTWNPLTDEKCPTKCSKRWCQLCHFYQLHKIVHKIQFVFYYLYCRITYVCFKITSYRIGKCEKSAITHDVSMVVPGGLAVNIPAKYWEKAANINRCIAISSRPKTMITSVNFLRLSSVRANFINTSQWPRAVSFPSGSIIS